MQNLMYKNYCCTNVTKTLRAPSGVTRVAGANIYAAKLSPSPSPTETQTSHICMHNEARKVDKNSRVTNLS